MPKRAARRPSVGDFGKLDGVAAGLQPEANLLREFGIVLDKKNEIAAVGLRLFFLKDAQIHGRSNGLTYWFGVGAFFSLVCTPDGAPIV